MYLMLSVIASKGLSNQDVKYIQQSFIEAFIKIDQKNLFDEKMRIYLFKLINFHFLRYPYMYLQPSSPIKEYFQSQDNNENCLLNPQKTNDRLFAIQHNESLHPKEITTQKIAITNKRIISKTFICQKGHQLFSEFLNTSMRRLNIEKTVQRFCKSIKAWTFGHSTGHTIESFLKKIIAIKSFYPHYFCQISKQFLGIIQKFKFSETKNEVQKYAKQMQVSRYQNCMKIYTESDDILTAADYLYNRSKLSIFGAKVLLFQDYQNQMKHRAKGLQAQKQKYIEASINLHKK